MKEKKRLYCYLELSEKDNTVSCEKQWKSVFISYLTHILLNNYHIALTLVDRDESLHQSGIDREKDLFLYLKIISNQTNSAIPSIESLSGLFDKSEAIGIIKEPLENKMVEQIPLRLFDFCPIDPETSMPIKADQLFEKENIAAFLSKVSIAQRTT